jgi:hypothetical protein
MRQTVDETGTNRIGHNHEYNRIERVTPSSGRVATAPVVGIASGVSATSSAALLRT